MIDKTVFVKVIAFFRCDREDLGWFDLSCRILINKLCVLT